MIGNDNKILSVDEYIVAEEFGFEVEIVYKPTYRLKEDVKIRERKLLESEAKHRKANPPEAHLARIKALQAVAVNGNKGPKIPKETRSRSENKRPKWVSVTHGAILAEGARVNYKGKLSGKEESTFKAWLELFDTSPIVTRSQLRNVAVTKGLQKESAVEGFISKCYSQYGLFDIQELTSAVAR